MWQKKGQEIHAVMCVSYGPLEFIGKCKYILIELTEKQNPNVVS